MTGDDKISAERNSRRAIPTSSQTSAVAQPSVSNVTQASVEIASPTTAQPLTAPAQPSAAKPQQPVLVTATQNSDVGLPVVESQPREYRFSAPTSSAVRGVTPDSFKETPVVPIPEATEVDDTQSKEELLAQSSGYNSNSLKNRPFLRSTALTPPNLTFQGVYLYQGDQTSARARLTRTYPLSPSVLVGATLDLTTGNAFTDTPENGFNVNELYVAIAPKDIPNLRFVVGQLDLTSYFDRNSFAKDGASQFFNPVFQTNPALSATGIVSRPGALVNFS